MKSTQPLVLVFILVVGATAVCENWRAEGAPKRCQRDLITHILSVCGDFEALSNAEPVENLPTCCCIFGCSDEFLRAHLCPQVAPVELV